MSDTKIIFECSLCDRTFDEIPPDAIRLTNFGGRGRANTYKFGGTIHIITRKTVQSTGEKQQ